jgi:hypothetical protein
MPNALSNFAFSLPRPYKDGPEHPGHIQIYLGGTVGKGAQMKSHKMFGLVTLSAMMVMALVGAPSAMATGSTALCASEAATCASPITHVHETSIGKMKILSSLPTIECNVLFLGDTPNGGLGHPLVITGKFTYSSCNNFCSVNEPIGTEAKLEILKELGVELASSKFGSWLIHVSCPFMNCFYTGSALEGDVRGPLNSPASANGSSKIGEQEASKGEKEGEEEAGCPLAFLDITTTPLSATYLSS